MALRWGQGADWDNAERVMHRTGWGGGGRTAAGGVSAFPTRILDQDLEAEAQRPVRLQVVAGPRNHQRRFTARVRDRPRFSRGQVSTSMPTFGSPLQGPARSGVVKSFRPSGDRWTRAERQRVEECRPVELEA